MGVKSDLRISALEVAEVPRSLLKVIGPPLDWLLGIRRLRRLYEAGNLAGLEKYAFLKRFLTYYKIRYNMPPEELARIPKTGRLVIVANHPLGGLEGIILAYILRRVRGDYKFFVNILLSTIKELKDFWICVNNNLPYAKGTFQAISECKNYLVEDHCMVLFPSGRVGVYDPKKGYVTDEKWNNISSSLVAFSKADVVPLYVHGTSSTFFNWATRIFYPAKLILLAWEFMYSLRKKVHFSVGHPIPNKILCTLPRTQSNAYLRMRTYLQAGTRGSMPPVAGVMQKPAPLILPVPPDLLKQEIRGLPQKQHLLDSRQFSVYYGYAGQLEQTIREIGRLRELTFRQLQEGSGLACDTDDYDRSYTQLFIWDNTARQIIGACRMGETGRILPAGGSGGMYLNQLYYLTEEVLAGFSPGLEIGRFFLAGEYQHSFIGLSLLRKGIGRFLAGNPVYRYLFSAVSLSTLYTASSLALMVYALTGKRREVAPRMDFSLSLHPEVEEYIDKYGLTIRELGDIIPALEEDGKGLPGLIKQYAKFRARFLSVSLDANFNNTPGIFMLIDMLEVSEIILKRCLGGEYKEYLAFHGRCNEK